MSRKQNKFQKTVLIVLVAILCLGLILPYMITMLTYLF